MNEFKMVKNEENIYKYGLPDQKKYPMPDAKHVKSAIKFFNYVDAEHEEELAKAILNRIREYGMDIEDLYIGEDNRFSKYIPKNELSHHGIKGQKWGDQNGPPYPLDYDEHSAAEKKKNPKSLLDNYQDAKDRVKTFAKNSTAKAKESGKKAVNEATKTANDVSGKTKSFVKDHKKGFTIGAIAGLSVLAVGGLAAAGSLYVKNKHLEEYSYAQAKALSWAKIDKRQMTDWLAELAPNKLHEINYTYTDYKGHEHHLY